MPQLHMHWIAPSKKDRRRRVPIHVARRAESPADFTMRDVNEIIGKFCGADQLRNAMNQLQSLLLYADWRIIR